MIKPINVNIVFGLSNCLVTSSSSISYALTSSLLELDELDSPASDELDPPALAEEAAFAVKPTVSKFSLASPPSIWLKLLALELPLTP